MPANLNDNIYLFIPNVIGYLRIFLLIVACWHMKDDCSKTVWAYLLSGLLDAFDGHAARILNQCTKFGAMLDMLVDRCATMCLLVALSFFYPSYMFVFQLSMIIDISSHWLHMHTSILGGGKSHKSINFDGNPILKLYYTSRPVLFCMCAGNELFYSMLYIMHFSTGPLVFGVGLVSLLAMITFPIAIVKSGISLLHLYAASVNLVQIDGVERQATVK